MALSRARRTSGADYWPGFVDAMSSLLLVIIFLLSLFMLTQFFLSQEILGKDTALSRLNSQIAELTELLQLERASSDDLESTIATLTATLSSTQSQRDALETQLAGIGGGIGDRDARIAILSDDLQAQEELTDEATEEVSGGMSGHSKGSLPQDDHV